MADIGDAEFVVSIDTSQLVAGTDKAKQVFQQMADAGTQSMNTIQVNTDKVTAQNSKMADSAEQTSSRMGASFSSVIGPMTGLAAGSAALVFSFDSLERS